MINPGDKAPEFRLPSTTGQPVTLGELSASGRVLLVFVTVECLTSRLALERLEAEVCQHATEPAPRPETWVEPGPPALAGFGGVGFEVALTFHHGRAINMALCGGFELV
jgi:hypothetical protein